MAQNFSVFPDQNVRDHHVFIRMAIVAAVAVAIIGGIFAWQRWFGGSDRSASPAASKKTAESLKVQQARAQKSVAAALVQDKTIAPAAQSKAVAAALARSQASSTATVGSQAATAQMVSDLLRKK